jgi:hypothetical protein
MTPTERAGCGISGQGDLPAVRRAPSDEAMEVTPAQRAGIKESKANIAANPDVELLRTRVLKNGDEFGGYPDDARIVEFTYRDLVNDTGIPGREVTVFAVDGKVLDSQDFG